MHEEATCIYHAIVHIVCIPTRSPPLSACLSAVVNCDGVESLGAANFLIDDRFTLSNLILLHPLMFCSIHELRFTF